MNGTACERCVRHDTECTYSPSLRYRKHPPRSLYQHQGLSKQDFSQPLQGHGQGQSHAHDEAPTLFELGPGPGGQPSETCQQSPRPPLNGRLMADTVPSLVQPDASDLQRSYLQINTPTSELTKNHCSSVTPGSLYALSSIGFVVNQDELLQQHAFEDIESSLATEYLSQHALTSNAGNTALLHHPHQQSQHQVSHPGSLSVDVFPWSDQQPLTTATCPDIGALHQVAQPASHLAITQQKQDQEQLPPHVVPPPLKRRSCAPSHGSDSPSKITRWKGKKEKAKRSRLRRTAALTAASTTPFAQSSSNATTSQAPPSLPPTGGDSVIVLMAKLSTIQARLLELEGLLPKDLDGLIGERGKQAVWTKFPVKDMFLLTQNVTDILHNLARAGSATAVASIDNPPSGTQSVTKDSASSLFILSIYIRLLDVYGKMLALIGAEVTHAADTTSCNADDTDALCFQFWALPDMKMEDFSLCATPYLHMGLTLRVTEQLLAKLRAATLELYEKTDGAYGTKVGGDGLEGIVCVSYQALHKTEDDLKTRLTELREEIEFTYE